MDDVGRGETDSATLGHADATPLGPPMSPTPGPRQARADRHSGTHRNHEREDRFRRHGLEVFRITGPDLSRRTFVAQRMLAARERARWEDPARRRWTIADPLQDEPGESLEDFLDRRDLMAELHA